MKPYDRNSEKTKVSQRRVSILLEEQEGIQQELLDSWWRFWKKSLFINSGKVNVRYLAKVSCENTQ